MVNSILHNLKKLKLALALVLILTFVRFTLASTESVSINEVLQSAFKHHPLILSQLKELEQAQNYVRQNLGAFDLTLKGGGQSYTDGYYDGSAFNVFLEKPLFYLNSKAYAGYRKSDGSFPIYNQDVVTLEDGEFFAGLAISLLRDRNIDEKRLKLILARQDLVQSELGLKLKYIEIQTMAAMAYYNWLSQLENLRIYTELLSLAESRVQSFETRIKKGDLAKIYGVENEQYILKRRFEVNQQRQSLYQAALYLSLFYRDPNGKPIILKENNNTTLTDIRNKKTKPEAELINVVNAKDLNIKTMQSQITQAEAQRKVGANELLPRLDLKYEISDDSGLGPNNLSPLEQKVYLNLEIPIERRFGSGAQLTAKSKKEALEIKLKFQKEQNQMNVRNLLNSLKLAKDNFELTKQEISLSSKLRKSEMVKFNKGASDFILVNLREENLAQSKLKNVKAFFDYNQHFIELQRLAVDFIVPIPIQETSN